MRIAATAATLLFAMTACSTIETEVSPYQQPNALMSTEINQRIDQIPYQHREELVQNLLWLAQTGEQTIPALLNGLNSENPKVRSSCCWVLGRLRDRRTVPTLQALVNDSETSVRMEASRTLVLMGDLQQSPKLIEGLDSDRKEVRYMCHEALKVATGHDFGYDHLDQDQQQLQFAVLRWRQWWGEYAGDTFFASSYEQEHGLNNLAAPGGETQLQDTKSENSEDSDSSPTDTSSDTSSNSNSSDESTSAPAVIEEVIPASTTTENGSSTKTLEVPGEGAVAPAVPLVTPPTAEAVETIEVIEIGSENANSGTETSSSESTKPIPVIEVPPATGGSVNGGTGTGTQTGSGNGGN